MQTNWPLKELRRELQLYTHMRAASGWPQGSSLGRLSMPRQLHKSGRATAMDRIIWLIDFERAMAQLEPRQQIALTLWGEAHSQDCIAETLGICLRTCLRLCADSLDDLLAVRTTQGEAPVKVEPKTTQHALARVPAPPRCECRGSLPGRRPKQHQDLQRTQVRAEAGR